MNEISQKLLNKRALCTGVPTALILSFCAVMGRAYDRKPSVGEMPRPLTNGRYYLYLLVLAALLYPVIVLLWSVLDTKGHTAERAETKEAKKWHFILWFLLLFVSWIPCWLAAFPGFFCYDATQEFNSVYVGMFSEQHPLLHSMLLTYCMTFFYDIFGTYNVGIAVYCVAQMLFGAAVFTYVIYFIDRYVGKKVLLFISIAYYMFCPVIVLFSSCTTKDVMSGLLFVLFILRYYELFWAERNTGKKDYIGFTLLAVLTLFSKKNMVPALCLFLVLELFSRKYRKKRVPVLLISLGLYFCGSLVLRNALHAEPSAISEALSIPAQQIASVYTYENGAEAFSDTQWNLLNDYFVEEELRGNYCPYVSDPVKQRVKDDAVMAKPFGFLQLWATVFAKYPERYFDAFNDMTYQAWYPFTDMTGYNRTWYAYQGVLTCFFRCEVEPPGTLSSVLPSLHEKIWQFSLNTSIYKIPVIGMLCSIGFHMWVLLFVTGYCIYTGRGHAFPLLCLPWCFLLTNFLGPMVLIRYYLILFYMFPVFISILFFRPKNY